MLQFETSTACNGECTFCMHSRMKRRGVMPLSRIVDLTYHLAWRAKNVCPFGMQEPLLDKRLAQVLVNTKCFAPSAQTYIYTNMSTYPEEALTNIIRWGVLDTLIISFYGATREVYGKLQPPLNYDVTRRNIKWLMKLKRRLRWNAPQVVMELLVCKETEPHLDKMLREWRGVVDRVGFTPLDSWGGNVKTDDALFERVFGKPPPRVPCVRLWNQLNVHFDGTVSMCCLDYDDAYPLGNVWEDGMDVWWRSERLQELRRLHEEERWGEIPLCRECSAWKFIHNREWVEHWGKQSHAAYAVNL